MTFHKQYTFLNICLTAILSQQSLIRQITNVVGLCGGLKSPPRGLLQFIYQCNCKESSLSLALVKQCLYMHYLATFREVILGDVLVNASIFKRCPCRIASSVPVEVKNDKVYIQRK